MILNTRRSPGCKYFLKQHAAFKKRRFMYKRLWWLSPQPSTKLSWFPKPRIPTGNSITMALTNLQRLWHSTMLEACLLCMTISWGSGKPKNKFKKRNTNEKKRKGSWALYWGNRINWNNTTIIFSKTNKMVSWSESLSSIFVSTFRWSFLPQARKGYGYKVYLSLSLFVVEGENQSGRRLVGSVSPAPPLQI